MQEVATQEEFLRALAGCPAVLALFGGTRCTVCTAIRPKIDALCASAFPRLKTLYVDCERTPDIPAQLGILSVPVAVAFFEGRETVRLIRTFGMSELADALQRPYQLFFD